jgi:hypothetical protein
MRMQLVFQVHYLMRTKVYYYALVVLYFYDYVSFYIDSLLDDDNLSTISGNQNSSNEDLDEVEDKMPEISTKKVCFFFCNHFF